MELNSAYVFTSSGGEASKQGVINEGAVITVTTTTGLPYTGGQNFGNTPGYPQQLPPYQPPYGVPGDSMTQTHLYPANLGM